MTTIKAFFLKISALFPIFKKGQGRPPPHNSSYALGKSIPRSVLLFMHFPKRSNFQVSFLPIVFSANPYFLKPVKLSNRRKNDQDTIISVFQNKEHLVILH